MPKIKGTMTTIPPDGLPPYEQTEIDWHLIPPHMGLCQTCARKHEPHEPHDPTTLYYKVAFHAVHGRTPTWEDALAHCTPEVAEMWRTELRKFGIDPECDP